MKVFRYTVNGRGIFISLKNLDEKRPMMTPDEADSMYEAEARFNAALECPPIYKGYRNWFTQAGLEEFGEELDILLSLYEKYGFKPEERITEVTVLSDSKYSDKYQVLLPVWQTQ